MSTLQTSAQLVRKHTWQQDLHAFVDARAGVPFAWGTNDCALFAADAVLAMTDVDLAADYRGQYSDANSAAATMAKVTGGTTVEDVLLHAAAEFALTEWPSVKFAQRGDLALLDGEEGLAVGVVYLNGVDAVFVSPEGLKRRPVVECRRAWRVG